MVIDYKILTHEQLMTEKAHLIIKLNAQIAINDFKEAQITKSELVELIAIEKLKITQTKKSFKSTCEVYVRYTYGISSVIAIQKADIQCYKPSIKRKRSKHLS